MIPRKKRACIPVGSTFGWWTVTGETVYIEKPKKAGTCLVSRTPCVCKCGTTRLVNPSLLRAATSKSCGCYVGFLRKTTPSPCKTHGLSGHPLHSVWCAMRSRCLNPDNSSYGNYGGRGITVCDEWSDFGSFYEWAIPKWSPGLTLDRTDNACGYSPSNCRFVTMVENLGNRRTSVLVTYSGSTYTAAAFADMLKTQRQRVAIYAKKTSIGEEIIQMLAGNRVAFTAPKNCGIQVPEYTPTRRVNGSFISFMGEEMLAKEFAKKISACYSTIQKKATTMRCGQSIIDALHASKSSFNRIQFPKSA